MNFGCRNLSYLCSVFASVWAMTQCMSQMLRSRCHEEATLAQKSSRHLTHSLRRLHHLFQEENIHGSEMGVCVPEESNSVEWSIQLDKVAQRLCQYKVCLERVGKALDTFNANPKLKHELNASSSHLDNLLTALEKMKRPFHLPGCPDHHVRTESLWLEVSNGHRLAHNLLGDLGHLTIKSFCH